MVVGSKEIVPVYFPTLVAEANPLLSRKLTLRQKPFYLAGQKPQFAPTRYHESHLCNTAAWANPESR